MQVKHKHSGIIQTNINHKHTNNNLKQQISKTSKTKQNGKPKPKITRKHYSKTTSTNINATINRKQRQINTTNKQASSPKEQTMSATLLHK